MHRLFRHALAASSIAVGLASFLVALELSAAATPAGFQVAPQQVERALKGDRLPLKAAADSAVSHPNLPDGCITATEADKKHVYTAEIAGRCVV
jgi:hypothetical protein